MIKPRYREYLYDGLQAITRFNLWFYKAIYFRRSDLKVHLGCGSVYVNGWVNIDTNPLRRKDVWLDVRNGLPFRSDSVVAIFTSHLFEHFTEDELHPILNECYRVIRPEGIIRIAVPSLEKFIEAYVRRDSEFFYQGGKSIGKQFNDTALYHGAHKLILDFSYLEELLTIHNFRNITRAQYRKSLYLNQNELEMLESKPKITLFIEAQK